MSLDSLAFLTDGILRWNSSWPCCLESRSSSCVFPPPRHRQCEGETILTGTENCEWNASLSVSCVSGSGILSLYHFHGLGFILLPLLSISSLQKLNMLSIQGLEKGIINALNSSINSSSVRTATERAVLRYEEKLGVTQVWHSGYVKGLWTVR